MKLEDLLVLAIPVAFILLWGSEYLINRTGGGRTFPKVRWWFVAGVGFFLLLSAINATAPLWLPPEWLAKHRLMDLTGLGVWWGALVGYAATSFGMYWFHPRRAQIHGPVARPAPVPPRYRARGHGRLAHRPSVGDASPDGLTITGNLGPGPGGSTRWRAAVAGTFGTIANMFGHWNVSTPHWLGYVFLRPEQHCQHHEREIHARNYGGDFAIWDQLFGSFANTPAFNPATWALAGPRSAPCRP